MSYNRNKETQRRLAKIGKGAGYKYSVGVYWNDEKQRWEKYYVGNKYFKNLCHRKLRQYYRTAVYEEDCPILEKGDYNKATEYWWTIL